jgi:type II secretory pathway component GspD/PulD (secretin)
MLVKEMKGEEETYSRTSTGIMLSVAPYVNPKRVAKA